MIKGTLKRHIDFIGGRGKEGTIINLTTSSDGMIEALSLRNSNVQIVKIGEMNRINLDFDDP